jgi:hypothetical protein
VCSSDLMGALRPRSLDLMKFPQLDDGAVDDSTPPIESCAEQEAFAGPLFFSKYR